MLQSRDGTAARPGRWCGEEDASVPRGEAATVVRCCCKQRLSMLQAGGGGAAEGDTAVP